MGTPLMPIFEAIALDLSTTWMPSAHMGLLVITFQSALLYDSRDMLSHFATIALFLASPSEAKNSTFNSALVSARMDSSALVALWQ